MKKLYTLFAAIILAFAAVSAGAAPAAAREEKGGRSAAAARVSVPLNLAILIQDDLVSRVGNEIKVTRQFINHLPAGSQVMIGYIRAGSLQVAQPFTTDLAQAGKALRMPVGSTAASPYNPYVELRDALKQFPAGGTNRNAVLLVSDGLDTSHGFDYSSSVNSHDLRRAVIEAKKRYVAVYTFYAPSVGLTSHNRLAVSFGQSALTRLADETGGRAFFQGSDFVTFDAYFERLSKTINERYGRAY
jgi:hypothetical protein